MLGQSEPASTQMEDDALREIANVICGNALPAIYGLTKVFNLSTPELYSDFQSIHHLSEYSCIGQASIPFDSGQANVSLYVETGAEEFPSIES